MSSGYVHIIALRTEVSIRHNTMNETELRYEIVRFCQFLHHKGYLSANDGNISVKLGDGRILITPTGIHKGFLNPEDMVVVNEQGTLLSGTRNPSGELPMHLTVYKTRPDVQAVVHAHPPYCIALSLLQNIDLNGILPEVTLSIGKFCIAPYGRPISQALGDSLYGFIEKNDALILERHGTLTVGKTVAEAYYRTERIEHAAFVLWLAYSLGKPKKLPGPEYKALLDMYESSRS